LLHQVQQDFFQGDAVQGVIGLWIGHGNAFVVLCKSRHYLLKKSSEISRQMVW
jgi:hypothetical protein